MRVAICTHIVERQILEYIDEKYQVLEEKNDQRLASNIKMLNTPHEPDPNSSWDSPPEDTNPLNPRCNTASIEGGLNVNTPPRRDSGTPRIIIDKPSGNVSIPKKIHSSLTD